MRRTKIVATLGPASSSDAVIEGLIAAGVDVFRLNFSHGTYDTHGDLFARARRAAGRVGRVVGIMQDLSGPKIRTGPLAGGRPVELRDGSELRIAAGEFAGAPGRISTTYEELVRAAGPGDRLLLDDGRLELRVVRREGDELVTIVVGGGPLGEHKGINAPGIALSPSALTEKDVRDLAFGVSLGVDLVAVSFVESAQDLVRARALLEEHGAPALPLVAKIERPRAVSHIDEILGACQGVMVARGDLGLEVPLEHVPRIQKDITRRARARGVPVIVATQVLESMRVAPRPTRAEVSDAANAVEDGVDAIMLAGETAVGAFPIRTVQVLDAIVRDGEALPRTRVEPTALALDRHGRALGEAAATLARVAGADAIIAVTRAGRTARMLSSLRPSVPVFAATTDETTARWLALQWGVTPVVCEMAENVDTTGRMIERHLVSTGALPGEALVVFVSVNADLTRVDANFLHLERLKAG